VLCEKHAASKIHPDLATSGGILETHKIADMAEDYEVPMAMHFAGNALVVLTCGRRHEDADRQPRLDRCA